MYIFSKKLSGICMFPKMSLFHPANFTSLEKSETAVTILITRRSVERLAAESSMTFMTQPTLYIFPQFKNFYFLSILNL